MDYLEQKASELLRCLRRGWKGDWVHFEQFSARYLTQKGEDIAKAIPVGQNDMSAAMRALRAGF